MLKYSLVVPSRERHTYNFKQVLVIGSFSLNKLNIWQFNKVMKRQHRFKNTVNKRIQGMNSNPHIHEASITPNVSLSVINSP